MALQYSFTDQDTSIKLSTAYTNICTLSINFLTSSAVVTMAVYQDQQSYINSMKPFKLNNHFLQDNDFKTIFVKNDAGSTTFSNIYNYLKTLPEFSGATDC